ncbi:UPF0657 nucleolar protein YBR141C [Kluyveromyces marxianus]|uniref:25S rRNA adenine-N(1) methyltransferase n=2 Tax=Kluyveromyces marxianus TaxID=4911 RepID=W0T7T7_KLUMD|nr:uncharacterized protein KLMA_30392 [Kluyveromyces marxianus DMKU3-1042]QGN15402.1 UPF0657 nucleolar protein YBR141C [Kluyveromyces marxianus]BAO39687.1 UPF0657 nucleolar protein YBR141C [Kluyveromyces marxianus DMKU3-1042]BAP71171.1 UPF0657 nucleolar protein YBR141C [Kluyveromyces marxianus]
MLSRRKRTITGKPVIPSVPKIKPVKARRIIRRFHLLIQKRRIICQKLRCKIVDNDEEANVNYIQKFFEKNISLRESYTSGKESSHPNSELEKLLISVQSVDDRNELCRVFGYICAEIQEHGGLQNYQMASTVGQDANRGGDSSKQLVSWCEELSLDKSVGMTALELGSLSAKNYISTSGIFNPVVRIDLNSNDPVNIKKQDFMDMEIPKNESQRFDLISCSLVLNFVPTPIQRGQMICRFQEFLKHDKRTYLFIVLPLPCITNSRYMNRNRFCQMMEYLGYSEVRYREAKKLVYWLFDRDPSKKSKGTKEIAQFTKKTKIEDKPGMNNFAITLMAK